MAVAVHNANVSTVIACNRVLEISDMPLVRGYPYRTEPSAHRWSREHVANGKFEHKGGSAANYSQVVAVTRPVRILHAVQNIPGRTAGKAHSCQRARPLPATSSAPLPQQGHFPGPRYREHICIAHIQRTGEDTLRSGGK